MCTPSVFLIGCCVNELHSHLHVPIVMYGLRLFIVVLQEQHFVYVFVSSELMVSITFVALHLLVSEIAKCIA